MKWFYKQEMCCICPLIGFITLSVCPSIINAIPAVDGRLGGIPSWINADSVAAEEEEEGWDGTHKYTTIRE